MTATNTAGSASALIDLSPEIDPYERPDPTQLLGIDPDPFDIETPGVQR